MDILTVMNLFQLISHTYKVYSLCNWSKKTKVLTRNIGFEVSYSTKHSYSTSHF